MTRRYLWWYMATPVQLTVVFLYRAVLSDAIGDLLGGIHEFLRRAALAEHGAHCVGGVVVELLVPIPVLRHKRVTARSFDGLVNRGKRGAEIEAFSGTGHG